MLPDISFLGKTISLYTVMAVIGILAVFVFQQRYTKKKGHDEIFMLYILLFGAIGVFIGGHILYAITMYKYIIAFFKNITSITSFKEFMDWMTSIFGGSVFYGGLFGGLIYSYLYMRRKKIDLDPYIGIGALCIPLFHFFGRIGCFLSGCCYGVESTFGFDLIHSHAPGCAGVTRFPVQLLEATVNLLIFNTLFVLFHRKKIKGKTTFVLYMFLYASARFYIETLRGDTYRGYVGNLSTSQLISACILIGLLVYEFIKPKIDRKKTIAFLQ